MSYYLIYLGIAFILSYLLISPFAWAAKRYEIVSKPDKNVASRKVPIPYLGGGALYFGFVLALLSFLYWKIADIEFAVSLSRTKLLGILIGAAVASFAGLIRDIYNIPVLLRIVFQILAGFLLTRAGILVNLEFFQLDTVNYLPTVVTILWTVLVINVFEMSDIVDGLVSGIGVVIGAFLFAIAIFTHNYESALLASILTGVILGGFVDQVAPGQILLGKMGTNFIGFMIAALTLNIHYTESNPAGGAAAIVLLGVPFLAALLPSFSKILHKGEAVSVQEGLNKLEWRESKTIFFSCLIAAVGGVFAFLILFSSSAVAFTVLSAFLLFDVFVAYKYASLQG